MHFKHEIISIWQSVGQNSQLSANFELTVFELAVPDLYQVQTVGPVVQNLLGSWKQKEDKCEGTRCRRILMTALDGIYRYLKRLIGDGCE